jgi:uncharacterized protein YndB with AHSA1/START domain
LLDTVLIDVELRHSITIGRPPDEVFDLVGNPDNDTKWGTLIAESRQVSPGSVSVGTQFEQMATFLGARLAAEIEVTEYETDRRLCYRVSRPVSIEHCRTVEPAASGTLLTFVTSVEFGSTFRLPESFLRQIGRRQLEADMDDIKALMEGQEVSAR